MSEKITDITTGDGPNKYQFESKSGHTYTIKYCGSGNADPEFVGLWECDCPAGVRGRACRHIDAVIGWADAQYQAEIGWADAQYRAEMEAERQNDENN